MTDLDALPLSTWAATDRYPAAVRERLHALRDLILDVAASTEGVGPLVETLKWGQPSFLPAETRSGTTVRIDRVRGTDDTAVFVHCQTSLVDDFRHHHGDHFVYDGSRAIVLPHDEPLPVAELRDFVRAALTYHRRAARARPATRRTPAAGGASGSRRR